MHARVHCEALDGMGIRARAREQIREEELNSRLGRPGGAAGEVRLRT